METAQLSKLAFAYALAVMPAKAGIPPTLSARYKIGSSLWRNEGNTKSSIDQQTFCNIYIPRHHQHHEFKITEINAEASHLDNFTNFIV